MPMNSKRQIPHHRFQFAITSIDLVLKLAKNKKCNFSHQTSNMMINKYLLFGISLICVGGGSQTFQYVASPAILEVILSLLPIHNDCNTTQTVKNLNYVMCNAICNTTVAI